MVTWAGDGTMAGYDPITKKLKKGLYHFASPGTVDLGGVTRLHYPMGSGINLTTYPNNLQAQAPLTFSPADFTANAGKKLGVGLIIVRSSRFAEGHTPTPAEIWALPQKDMDWGQRATEYVLSGPGPFTHTFELPVSNQSFAPNTKWWVMIYPAAHINPNTTWSKTNDAPIAGSSINSVARVLSFWSNRTPAKPTIAQPADGTVAAPGTEFTLRLNPGDPDEVVPEDADKYNDDVNGVHFQYREAPSISNPDPDWADLPFDWTWDYGSGPANYRREAWHIRGSRWWGGLPGTPEFNALVTNLGCTVVAGGGDRAADLQPGKGALPTGNWQIRGRTFDYGHPYPNSGTVVYEPGPLGINPATQYLLEPAKDTYPTENVSPWSDPVTVTIPAQVPPPLPVSPVDSVAVSGNSVRLRWQYRNAHQPPRDQYSRTVQIRKVGDTNWSTVFNGPSSDAFVDLPFDIVQSSIAPMDTYVGDFEDGTLGGWNPDPSLVAPSAATNVNNPANAHSGNRYLNISYELASNGAVAYTLLPDPDHGYVHFEVDGWVYVPPNEQQFIVMQAYWLDLAGEPVVDPPFDPDWPYFANFMSRPAAPGEADPGGWTKLSSLIPFNDDNNHREILRHPDGVAIQVVFSASSNITGFDASDTRIDDWVVHAEGTLLESFHMEATNQYEWRVSVLDTDNIESGYSTPARFWVVPGAATGEIVPVPSSTIEGATLGCGTHHVEVFKRGGKIRAGVLDGVSHVDWARVRDDISTAQVNITGWSQDCGKLLSKIEPWAHELVIFRDNGYSVDRVWEGPVSLPTYKNGEVILDAKDVMNYPYRRIIKQKMTDSGTGHGTTVVDRARRILQNVLAPDDPNLLAYLQILARDDDAMQYRSIPAWSRTAFEEIDDMAQNAGLDYTAVGRTIMLWGTKHRIGTLPELRDSNLGDSPIVSVYGMSAANVYSVSDGNGVHGEATRALDPVSGNNPDYGLIEMLSSTWASDSESDTGTYTQAGLETVTQSFKDFAERSISDRWPPPVVVRIPDNTSLNPNTPLSIQHLVPGVAFPLRSTGTLRTVVGTQKLDSVKVVEEAGKETISITCSPFSRDDGTLVDDGGDA